MNSRLITSFFLVLVVAGCSPDPDVSGLVLDFQSHKKQGDVDAILEMFTDEPVMHFGPIGSISGIDEVRGILEYDVALDTQLRFEDCKTLEREVSCRVVETNDWLQLANIQSITYDENRFVFTPDGRIESIAATLSDESSAVLGAAMGEFDVWARMNAAEEYTALFSADGRFVFSHENGAMVLALLRRWRAARPTATLEESPP